MNRKALIIGGVAAAVLLIGGIAAANGKDSTAAVQVTPTEVTKTVTVTAPPKTVTVTAPPVTVTAPPPAPVTVTAPPPASAPAAASADPSGPKKDGTYVVGSEIAPGNWKCTDGQKAGGMLYWSTTDQSGELIDNGMEGLAFVGDDAFSVWLDDCASTWVKVG